LFLSKERASTAASSVSKTAYASPLDRPSALRIRCTLASCSVGGELKKVMMSSAVAVKGRPLMRRTPR